jgi:3-hydroxy-3-methylglutaryl CoA synthase
MKMNELILKLATILDEKLSKKDKVIKCFSAMSGLEISALSSDQKNSINKQLLAINGILKQYPIKTYDDYSLISDNHLNKLLKNIKRVGLIFCD